MPNSQPVFAGTSVYFVQPDPPSKDGMLSLGCFTMQVPPRIHETVTIQNGFGGVPQRFQVMEVIHHIPPMHAAAEIVMDVTCVIKPVVTDGDVALVVAMLCRRPPSDPPADKDPAPALPVLSADTLLDHGMRTM